MAQVSTITVKTINSVAKSINARRNDLQTILDEFRAEWGHLDKDSVKSHLEEVKNALQADPKNAELKAERNRTEHILAHIKAVTLSVEERVAIQDMMDKGLRYECLTIEWVEDKLRDTAFINDEGEICELKKNKETGASEYKPIAKWTVMKLAKYFRLAFMNC